MSGEHSSASSGESEEAGPGRVGLRRRVRLRPSASQTTSESSTDSSSSASTDSDWDQLASRPQPGPEVPCPVLAKPPHPMGTTPVQRLFERECFGQVGRLRSHFMSAVSLVQRLELAYQLQAHEGCVNALHFNASGTRLASGSDDLDIIIWEWERRKPALSFHSGHRANVFQTKFLALDGDTHLVSTSRDGQVRLAELSAAGVCHQTKRLAQHRGPAHKLTLIPSQPHTLLSGGEDGAVIHIDIREAKPGRKLLVQLKNEKKIPIYSIDINQANDHMFCTSGRDQFIRLYDRRHVATPTKTFCPHHLIDHGSPANVTCAVFSGDGTEVLGSYNDDDIYLFRTEHSDGADYRKRYQGHRNSATVKGVNFYGGGDEFVISGSDCGHIFFWSKEQESIVHAIEGDEKGVVNVLEPHPHLPILATSGLDDEIKVWLPTAQDLMAKGDIAKIVNANHREREENHLGDDYGGIDGDMLWALWRQIQRSRAREENNDDDASSNGSSSDGDEDANAPGGRVQCPTS